MITARRAVGMTNRSSLSACGASDGIRNDAREPPTGSSMRDASRRRVPVLRVVITPPARSPATTLAACSCTVTA